MRSWLRILWPFGWTGAGAVVVGFSSFLIATHELGAWPWIDRRPLRERYVLKNVSRTSLSPVLSAPGRVESSRRTVVKCELENMAGASGGGSSTLLTVLPEGKPVKSGDILATLDVSTYEEMVRQQLITVEQAKASHLQAQLNHQISLLAVREYRDGTVFETLKGMEGSIALAQSDVARAREHLTWTKRMADKGYSSAAQIASEEQGIAKLDLALQQKLAAMELFNRFTLPKTEKTLQGQVKSAETSLGNETLRLQRQLERLALLQKQLARCTIRAPHDGLLLYHKDRQRAAIEEGMDVRQNQALFDLPDMSAMEVQVILNESVVVRVCPGQRVFVSFEAVPNLTLEGQVVSVGQIPFPEIVGGGQQRMDTGVRYFVCVVRLDKVAGGIKPGMTTMVDFILAPRRNVLAIPQQAVRSDRGKKICYVARGDELERREVTIGQDTAEMVEVIDGLNEGELVALDATVTSEPVQTLLSLDENEQRARSAGDSVATSRH